METKLMQKVKNYVKAHKVETALGAAATVTIIGLTTSLKMEQVSYGTGVGVVLALQWVNKHHPELDIIKEYLEAFPSMKGSPVTDFVLPS